MPLPVGSSPSGSARRRAPPAGSREQLVANLLGCGYDFVVGERYTIITEPLPSSPNPYRMGTTAFMSFSPVHRFCGPARLRSRTSPRRALRPERT